MNGKIQEVKIKSFFWLKVSLSACLSGKDEEVSGNVSALSPGRCVKRTSLITEFSSRCRLSWSVGDASVRKFVRVKVFKSYVVFIICMM